MGPGLVELCQFRELEQEDTLHDATYVVRADKEDEKDTQIYDIFPVMSLRNFW